MSDISHVLRHNRKAKMNDRNEEIILRVERSGVNRVNDFWQLDVP